MKGKGMANWGIILGWINVGLGLVVVCIIVLVVTGIIGAGRFLPSLVWNKVNDQKDHSKFINS